MKYLAKIDRKNQQYEVSKQVIKLSIQTFPNSLQDYNVHDYGSEFESDSEAERKRAKRFDLATGTKRKRSAVASKRELSDEYDK